jgi:DNA-binding PadR family transcriptional regulator
LRRPVTDIALLSFIAKKKASVISYTEATQACKSSSSASRALHQLIDEGMIEPQPKLMGLRYVTQYAVTPKGKQVSQLALHLTELRSKTGKSGENDRSRQSQRVSKIASSKRSKNSAASKSSAQHAKTRKEVDELNSGDEKEMEIAQQNATA